MKSPQIVIDTNVFVSSLRSQYGASYKLFMFLGTGKYEANISVPLALEYEETAKRLIGEIALTVSEIDDILDYSDTDSKGIFTGNRRIVVNLISLTLPDSLHRQVVCLAEKEKISVNHLIMLALAEKISALMTEEYIEGRAKRGSRTKFEHAMSKVSASEPEEYDRL